MATQKEKLDAELGRILKVAADMAPVSNELHQLQQTQSISWPWQVPQTPSYTSDHAPKPFGE